MGDDDMMNASTGAPVAGVCYTKGSNAGLPPVWLIYVVVEDIEASLTTCQEQGGTVLHHQAGPDGTTSYAVIRDPAGVCLALHRRTDKETSATDAST